MADAYTAFVLHLVSSEAAVPKPQRESGIRVYFNRSFEQRKLESLQQLSADNRITLEDVLETPENT